MGTLAGIPAEDTRTPACASCGEVIGLYEPLIAIERDRAHRTSLLAEPDLLDGESALHHLACYARQS